jgi:phosphosulfolactate synthase (CoM biosynthesis protein A)
MGIGPVELSNCIFYLGVEEQQNSIEATLKAGLTRKTSHATP